MSLFIRFHSNFGTKRRVAFTLLVIILADIFVPNIALALTGGPTQPEVQGFQQAGTSDMVDLFTGDFSYNLPLFEIGGYPMNLSYQSGSSVEDEASWVGFGWNLSPGAITRQLRGVPDDFNGDEIRKEFNMVDDTTWIVQGGIGAQLVGVDALPQGMGGNVSMGVMYNNQKGYGLLFHLNPSYTCNALGGKFSGGLGITLNSQEGISLAPNVGFQKRKNEGMIKSYSTSISGGYNSRGGLQSLNWSKSAMGKSKKMDSRFIGSLGGFISFNDNAFLPTPEMETKAKSINYEITLGGELSFMHFNGKVNGSQTLNQLMYNLKDTKSYGYMHLEHGYQDPSAILDYNKSAGGVYREDQPTLPYAYGTYDLFQISGQGVGGQFRAQRNDVGYFPTRKFNTISENNDIGGEFGVVGDGVHTGVSVSGQEVNSSSGNWRSHALAQSSLGYVGATKGQSYEPYTLQMTSSMDFLQPEDDDETVHYYEAVGGSNTVHVPLGFSDALGNADAEKKYLKTKGANEEGNGFLGYVNIESTDNPIHKPERPIRQTVVSYLNNTEASRVGLDKQIKLVNNLTCAAKDLYDQGQISNGKITTVNRTTKPAHHMSEVTVIQPGGMRYVYGLPAYNNTQRDVTFSLKQKSNFFIGGNPKSVIEYPSVLNTIDGQKANTDNAAKSKYFEAVTTPAYTYAHLLTAILSPDYADKTGNGITDDDNGTAVKVSYCKVSDYKWRTPYGQRTASYQPGHYQDEHDDRGNYVYGEKDIYYVRAMESKGMVAVFHTSERADALPVKNENGESPNQSQGKQRRLDKIELYTKLELQNNETNPVPYQTIHFDYNYSICGGQPNSVANGGGKLTLERVYTTFADNKTKHNIYSFAYKTSHGEESFTYPSEDKNRCDRWGTYDPSSPLSRYEFPYTRQDKTDADKYAGAFDIVNINLPTGGAINIQYEADDYAFVNNKKAGQMFKIKGFLSDEHHNIETDLPTNELYSFKLNEVGFDIDTDNIGEDEDEYWPNNYMVVQLPEEFENLTDVVEIRKRFFDIQKGNDQLRYRCMVNLIPGVGSTSKFDMVEGYFRTDISENSQIIKRDDNTLAIPIQMSDPDGFGDDKRVHPIAQTALQTMRLELNHLLFPIAPNGESSDVIATAIANMSADVTNMFIGFYRNCFSKLYAKTVNLDKAWVRLANPNFHKIGGGSRVKQISISDNWHASDPQMETGNYGQKYEYVTEHKFSGSSESFEISSGVASWEPSMGIDENLERRAEFEEDIKRGAPNNLYLTEQPIAEALYPSPVVGYSKVKVTDLKPSDFYNAPANEVPIHKQTGWTVHEFYTSRDFPMTRDMSNKDFRRKKTPILQLIFGSGFHYESVSQGYSVIVNDMHGKPKKTADYDAMGAELSSTEYKYQECGNIEGEDDGGTGYLMNTVKAVARNGVAHNLLMGVNIDIWNEFIEERTTNENNAAELNIDFSNNPTPGGVIPTFYGSYSNIENVFRSVTTAKLIHKSGILKEVIVKRNQASLATENVAYDSYTGNLLVQKIENEYGDHTYQTTLPAYMAYDGMEPSYRNIDFTIDVSVNKNTGAITPLNGGEMSKLRPGDEIYIECTNVNNPELFKEKYYYLEQPKCLIDEDGKVLKGTDIGCQTGMTDQQLTLKVVRSGLRNNYNAPIFQIVTNRSPIIGNQFSLETTDLRVLSATATEYSQDWHLSPTCDGIPGSGQAINPYTHNALGNWRAKATYALHGSRNSAGDPTSSNAAEMLKTDIRQDGFISDYVPYWVHQNINGEQNFYFKNTDAGATSRWIAAAQVTKYDVLGRPIEEKDALNIYSSEYFGYNDQLVVASSKNAQLRNIAFDSFEDYKQGAPSCNEFFRFAVNSGDISSTHAHTGKKSLLVNAASAPYTKVVNLSDINTLDAPGIQLPVTSLPDRVTDLGYQSFIPKFMPIDTARYVISAWVKLDDRSLPVEPKIEVVFKNNNVVIGTPVIIPLKGVMVEGWRRIWGDFKPPLHASKIEIRLIGDSNKNAFFDDLRIQPYWSGMSTFVYDATSQRLMATLDDNNYATFYEYNDAGVPVRLKRETEKGIVTVREGITNHAKHE